MSTVVKHKHTTLTLIEKAKLIKEFNQDKNIRNITILQYKLY